jgi:hypothetical protein
MCGKFDVFDFFIVMCALFITVADELRCGITWENPLCLNAGNAGQNLCHLMLEGRLRALV